MRLLKAARHAAALVLATATLCAWAQLVPDNPDWKEIDTPPPPKFQTSGLIPFDVSAGSSLRFGVDPGTLSIGKDGVLRYVVVASSTSGTVNAMYEGMRCSTGEYKTYARYNASGGWNQVTDPQWQPMRLTPNSRYAYMMARQGACPGGGTPIRLDEVIRELRRSSYIKSDHN